MWIGRKISKCFAPTIIARAGRLLTGWKYIVKARKWNVAISSYNVVWAPKKHELQYTLADGKEKILCVGVGGWVVTLMKTTIQNFWSASSVTQQVDHLELKDDSAHWWSNVVKTLQFQHFSSEDGDSPAGVTPVAVARVSAWWCYSHYPRLWNSSTIEGSPSSQEWIQEPILNWNDLFKLK